MKMSKGVFKWPEYIKILGGWISVEHPLGWPGRPSRKRFVVRLHLRHERGTLRLVLFKGKGDWDLEWWDHRGLDALCPREGLPFDQSRLESL